MTHLLLEGQSRSVDAATVRDQCDNLLRGSALRTFIGASTLQQIAGAVLDLREQGNDPANALHELLLAAAHLRMA